MTVCLLRLSKGFINNSTQAVLVLQSENIHTHCDSSGIFPVNDS